MLTMVLGGLWHGAAWTFVVWGVYHGVLLVVHRLASPWLAAIHPRDPIDRACWAGLRMFVTFHLVCAGWLIFRANTLEQAIGMLTSIAFRPAIPAAAYLAPVAFLIIPLWVVQLVQFSARDLNVIGAHALVCAGAFSIRHVSMRSCWRANSAASSSSTFSFDAVARRPTRLVPKHVIT